MKKKIMVSITTLSLAGLMAMPVFANEALEQSGRFLWKNDKQTVIETVAEKTGISVEDLLEDKQAGNTCKDILNEHGLSFDEVKSLRLEEAFKVVDEKVSEDIITEEEAYIIKEKIESYRFLQDGEGPHAGERQGMKLNLERGQMQRRGSRNIK